MAKSAKKETIENEKLAAILCYLLVGIIWYFADEKMKKSNLVKFHAKQGINLLLIEIIVSSILTVLIITIPLLVISNIFFLVLWILGLINAINEKEKEIPIIGKFADKYLTF